MPKNTKIKFSARLYAEIIHKQYNVLCDKNRILWIYDPPAGLWSYNGEAKVDKELREKFLHDNHLSNFHVREVISDLKALAFKDREFPEPEDCIIPFNNGVYNLKSAEFVEFKSEYHLKSKLAIDYNPDNKGCPLIEKIFQGLVTPEFLMDLYELSAYCLIPTYKIQEWFILLGSGRNGKSVYCSIIAMLLGKHNVSSVSLHQLQSRPFFSAELHGKFANIRAESQSSDLNTTDLLKMLTGGDLILAEKKHQQPFKFVNHAKLIFSANELPRTKDKTLSFYRRVRIIPFPYTFEGRMRTNLFWIGSVKMNWRDL